MADPLQHGVEYFSSTINQNAADPSGSLAGIVDSNLAGDMDTCLNVSVVCCQVEVSASD